MTEKRFENRLNKDNIKFNTLNPVWDNLKEDALNVFEMIDLLNELSAENQALKERRHEDINDLSVIAMKYKALEEENKELKEENEQLKQDKFICLDCKYSGYIEIGCLCGKKDHWTEYKTKCEDYEEFE